MTALHLFIESRRMLSQLKRRPHSALSIGSSLHLAKHFAVMVVLMYAGMFLLDPLYELLAGLAGVSNPWSRLPLLSNFAMALNMTIPMALHMIHKRHSWRSTAEMSAAMFLPAVLTGGPYLLGIMTAATMMTLSHAAMIPLMAVTVILRFTIMRSAAPTTGTSPRMQQQQEAPLAGAPAR